MNYHILLPTHQREQLLIRCLDSLVALGAEAGDTTVHLIENGSSVAQPIAGSFTQRLNLKYYHAPQGNKSKALNQVAKKLPSDAFLVFLDDDVALRPGTLAAFRHAAETFGPGHFFGGVLHPDYEVPPTPAVQPYLPPSARLLDFSNGKQYHVFRRFQFFIGSCWACFAGDLERAGWFNPDYGPGATSKARGQETDAQLRLFNQGCKPVGMRDAVVDHHVPARVVTGDYVVDRIYKAMVQPGERQSGLVKSLGIAAKLLYSVLLLPFSPQNVGHRYRIAKAAGYFRGLARKASRGGGDESG